MRYDEKLYDEKLIEFIDANGARFMSHKTKRAQAIIRDYNKAIVSGGRLLDCYDKPSWWKRCALARCERAVEYFGGRCGRIIRHNCQIFSYAFEVLRENGTRWIVYMTPLHIYAIDEWVEQEAEFAEWLDERDKADLDSLEDFDELLEN